MNRTALLVALCTVPAFSMTLDEAVRNALENRNDVAAARSDLASAEWQRRSADLWFLPSVSFGAAFVRNHDVSVMEIPGVGSFPTGAEYASQVGITAAVPLFTAQGMASTLVGHPFFDECATGRPEDRQAGPGAAEA